MVFYRKYRPQKIEELDSDAVRESIYSAFSGNSFTHAFLFTGPKGLGKTSTARIVAKVINCEKHNIEKKHKTREEIEPCNKCEECVSITNGNNMDVLEIDGASNRGIDEIRDLRDKVKLAPFKAKRKVYIIDEVHMLTTEAFNALLKTLEEPPAHVVFIFCTTEPHKIPATILSRCFQVMFKKATEEELTRSFQRIVKAEKVEANKEGLAAIAHLSEGSFRDGAKILEEMVLLSNGKPITKELVEKKYKLTNVDSQVNQMLSFLKEKNQEKAFKLVSNLVESGVDIKYFLEKLINGLHMHLLKKVGILENEEQTEEFEIHEIKKLMDLFSKAYLDTKFAVLEQMPLELAIVEWTSEDDVFGQKSHILGDARQSNTDEKTDTRSLNESLSKSSDNKTTLQATAFDSSLVKQAGSFVRPKSGLSPSNITKLDKLFGELIEKVNLHNRSVAGVLRGCSIESFNGKKLTIETSYKFHKEKLEESKTKKIIEDVMLEITGDRAIISVILKS